jgi:hypothetical protein
MIHLYVLYACMHMIAGKHARHSGKTQCIESRVYFHAAPCEARLPRKGGLTGKSKTERSWLECEETEANSWIPDDPDDGSNRLYQAEASTSDAGALAALLAPFPPQARAAVGPNGLMHPLQRTYQGSGGLSFFVVRTGSSVVVFAVSNLDDFQFADIAAEISSSTATLSTEGDMDFAGIASDEGVQLSYHTVTTPRTLPPREGVVEAP